MSARCVRSDVRSCACGRAPGDAMMAGRLGTCVGSDAAKTPTVNPVALKKVQSTGKRAFNLHTPESHIQ